MGAAYHQGCWLGRLTQTDGPEPAPPGRVGGERSILYVSARALEPHRLSAALIPNAKHLFLLLSLRGRTLRRRRSSADREETSPD
ncbi:unnamed protein product [Boreogadus saida]